MKLTEEDYNGWRFNHNVMHINGGRVFFGYGHRCVDQPRLLVIDKYFKADRSTKRSYLIDEKTACETLDEALAILSEPPKPSTEQLGLLRTASDEWFRPEKRAPFAPLAAMGFIEWGRDADDRVTLRRTTAGRAALGAEEKANSSGSEG
jgi:hypothetical protein